jgi:hypothetical protein
MQDLFESGRVIDLALFVLAAEVVALGWRHRATGRGPDVIDLLANAAAGACLLLALRAALTGADWPWVAAALCGSLVAHLADLARRWPRRGQRP